ncbi:ATP-binding protein [Seleniivibrio woodruffii]|uniref:histidine kinase n=1 Tax=Seleniivibrio woodruffii TaxID=1078050 RepID=A0A4R1KE48_9BACT|nr:ATP-binding protein [Seleniivibrio woodruffii]TCK61529.1 PAS domain S-box-containing protein [Seleniivibrio woodruffii]TVZ35355.1 PAS domain S-box-containing protein [Seleniivibrio woodruffii]
MDNYLFKNRSGLHFFLLSAGFACAYIFLDYLSDTKFAHNDFAREFSERSLASVLFLFFAFVVWRTMKRMKSVEEKALEHDRKYKTYISNSPDPIIVCDRTGKIVESNPAMESISGYTSDELHKMLIQNMWSKDSVKEGYSALAKMLTADALDVTLKFLKKCGAEYYLSCHAVRVAEDRFLVMCRDMTSYVLMDNHIRHIHNELKEKVEEELKKRHRQEHLIENQKKVADMSKLLSAIAHQWRQPLNILALYNIDLQDSYAAGELNDKYIEDYNRVVSSTIENMSGIIDDFRLFFAPDSPGKEFNIVSELTDVMNILHAQINYLGIDTRFLCKCSKRDQMCSSVLACPDCSYRDVYVKGEQDRFRHVILNLIYNCIDSINEKAVGTPRYRGKISVTAARSDGSIKVVVADNGTGIKGDIMDKVFEPYFTTKEEGKGAGIGLFMARAVIKEHMHGDIELRNTAEGASAELNLPVFSTTIQ